MAKQARRPAGHSPRAAEIAKASEARHAGHRRVPEGRGKTKRSRFKGRQRTPKDASVAYLDRHLEILGFSLQERLRAPLPHTPHLNCTKVRIRRSMDCPFAPPLARRTPPTEPGMIRDPVDL